MFGLQLLPRSLEAALRDFASADKSVRASALRDLVRHARDGVDAAAVQLLAACDDGDDDVRAEAALGLADASVLTALPRLIELARHDPATKVRQLSLLALGELGALVGQSARSPGAAPDRADDDELHARAAAALEAGMQSDAASERFQALLGLHQLRAPAVAGAIIAGTADPDAEIRRLAFRIAEAHWSESDLPELVRARARAALADSRPLVRVAAGLLLAHAGDSSGVRVLVDLVAGRVPEASVEDQQAAIELAARHGLGQLRPELSRRAFGLWPRDPLAYDARIALARLGDARARSAILRALSAWTFDARTLAVAAVGRARMVEARGLLERFVGKPRLADPAAVAQALTSLGEQAREA